MSADRYTRCPHCKATFKVSEEQLGAANGRVRCGACMNIFDAIAYGVSINTDGQPDPSEPSTPPVDLDETLDTPTHQEAAPSPETETSLSASSADDHIDDDALIADDPDADRDESSGAFLSDELSTSFLELDQDERAPDPYSTDIQKVEEYDSTPKEDESWTQDILNDIEEDDTRKEPHVGDHDALETDHFEAPATESVAAYSSPPDDTEPARFFYEQESAARSHWLTRSLLYILCLALLIILIAQAGWFHYEKLARYPQVTMVYSKICEHLDCELPELRNLSKISSQNLVVRSHPTVRQALIIDTVIINEASFPQPFPDIALYFSDINNQVVAQRLIHPEEYLSPELLAWETMPPQQAIHISLELADPGKEAVNYQLRFFRADKRAEPAAKEEQLTDQLSTNKPKI